MISAFKNYQRYNIETRQVIPGDERCEDVAKAKNVRRGGGLLLLSLYLFGAWCLQSDACEKGHIAFVRPPPTSTLKKEIIIGKRDLPLPGFFLGGGEGL